MKQYFEDRILIAEKYLSKQLGCFQFFAVIELQDIQDRYDVLVSCKKNHKKDKIENAFFEYVKTWPIEEIVKINSVVVLNHEEEIVQYFNNRINTKHKIVELHHKRIGNIFINYGYIITSEKS